MGPAGTSRLCSWSWSWNSSNNCFCHGKCGIHKRWNNPRVAKMPRPTPWALIRKKVKVKADYFLRSREPERNHGSAEQGRALCQPHGGGKWCLEGKGWKSLPGQPRTTTPQTAFGKSKPQGNPHSALSGVQPARMTGKLATGRRKSSPQLTSIYLLYFFLLKKVHLFLKLI